MVRKNMKLMKWQQHKAKTKTKTKTKKILKQQHSNPQPAQPLPSAHAPQQQHISDNQSNKQSDSASLQIINTIQPIATQTMPQQQQHRQKLLQFMSILNSSTDEPHLREPQLNQLHSFIEQPMQRVISVCGVAGTGKTTAVLSLLRKHSIQHKYVNCLHLVQNQQAMLKSIASWSKAKTDQHGVVKVVVLDQCDCLSNLGHVISQLLDLMPSSQQQMQYKLILISNKNELSSQSRVGLDQEQVQTILFMPYQDAQVRSILQAKLNTLTGEDKPIIPAVIVEEAVRRVSKAGGDFREMQKCITTWIHTQTTLASNQSLINNNNNNSNRSSSNSTSTLHIMDPFLQILHRYLQASGHQHKMLLCTIFSILLQCQQEQASSKTRNKNKKTKVCRCRTNTFNRLSDATGIPKLKLAVQVRQLQEMGALKLKKARCGWHEREVELADVHAKSGIDLRIVKDLILDTLKH